MALTIGASVAILTPVATPVDMMVMGPGSYKFTDDARLGLPILAWFFVVSVFYVPMIWRF